MKARDLMTTTNHLRACPDSMDVRHVAQMMSDNDIGSIPVLDDHDRLEGIITDRDIACRIVAKGMSFETPVRDVMTAEVRTCRPDASLEEIQRIMEEGRIRRLPVVDEDRRLQGFIAIADLMRHCHGASYEHELCHLLDMVSLP